MSVASLRTFENAVRKGQTVMTEVRLLYRNEIQWAVNVAREAFVAGMSSCIRSQEEIDRFYSEVTPERLWQAGNDGSLFPWGVFRDGALCGVGAIQRDGRITMLYVCPDCQRRGMGLLLLNAMRDYAMAALGLSRVTIEVTPVTLAPYFYKRGFAVAPQGTGVSGSVLLECRLCPQMQNVPYVQSVPQMQNVPYAQPVPQMQPSPQNMSCGNQPVLQNQPQFQQVPNQPVLQSQPQFQQVPNQPVYLQRQEKEEVQLRVNYRKKKVSARAVLILTAIVLTVSFSVISGITLYHLAKEDRYTVKDYYDTMQDNEV